MRALQTRGIAAMAMLVALLRSMMFASGEEAKPELANVRLAVGGKPAVLPAAEAQRPKNCWRHIRALQPMTFRRHHLCRR